MACSSSCRVSATRPSRAYARPKGQAVTGKYSRLTAQLANAYEIGRRARKGADTNEKVRKAVTKCLRTSLATIQKAHLPLWRHLHTALKTGTFCSYTPAPPITWDV